MVEEHYPENTIPNPMDVVWCHFPYNERPGVPSITPHPCLVFDVQQYKNGYSVLVAFGTSKFRSTDALKNLNFQISNYNEMKVAGLYKATMFDLNRVKRLPWTKQFFSVLDEKKYSTPKIGCISQTGQQFLRKLLAMRLAKGMSVPVPKASS